MPAPRRRRPAFPPIHAIVLATTLAAPAVPQPVLAQARQDPAAVRRVVEDYLRVQTRGLPGTVSISVGTVDPNLALPACAAPEAALAPGARAWGRSSAVVSCPGEGGWRLFVPFQVRVQGDYLVLVRGVPQGQAIVEADLGRQAGDLAELPAGVLTDPAQAVGRTASMALQPGRPLRGDLLRQALAVLQGQSVKVTSRGAGFQVANEGRALNNAAPGQVVQVRLANGQVLSGIARPGGLVEVAY
ncbi:MAG: flagellar basal body P-ring formation protein FlgA [Rhodocyclaceae bacterium]|nr:flagellar basal body P-ring formation protein FlgA [Rhodocyclaceae bacterium]